MTAKTDKTDATPAPTLTVTMEQLQAILQSIKGDETARDQRLGEIMAQARQPKPENEHLPPDGKPDLKCKMFDCGMPVGKDVYTKEQLELLNQLEPGSYQVRKADNSTTIVEVVGERDPQGVLTQLSINRDAHGDKKHNWLPFVDVLRQMLAQQKSLVS